MGFERNADLVKISAYAPLVRRVGFPGNRYSLIRIGGLFSYGTPAYWCEKMFADNRPARTVAVSYPLVRHVQEAGVDRLGCRDCGNADSLAIEVVSFHVSGGIAENGELILKFANAAPCARTANVSLGITCAAQSVRRTVLAAAPRARNTPDNPRAVVPREEEFAFQGGNDLTLTLPPCSVTVLRLRLPRMPIRR